MREETSGGIGQGAAPPARGEDAAALLPGTHIGRYEFLSVLGHGGFGITYSARDTVLGRELAIKEYLPTALAFRNSDSVVMARSTQTAEDFIWGRERFLDEARTLATLEGAHGVVRVYDFLEANGTAYMVMALVRGETLEKRLQRTGSLPPPLVERLLHRLLDGLEQVHQAGFLHRDIKPANIILDSRDNPTLIDFGASRLSVADRTSAMTAVFTPRYAAAEQLMSDKQGPWTDIYGVAVTLYQAITGRSPPGALERALKDSHEPLTKLRPAGFPNRLLEALDAGLAVRAADRPQSVAQWRALLDGMAELTTVPRPRYAKPEQMHAPVSAVIAPSSAPTPTARWRTPLLIAALVAVLIAGVGGYFVFGRPGELAGTDRQRIEEQVRRAREQLAAAEQAAQRQADEEARLAREAETRRAAAEKQRGEEEAARQAALQVEQQRRERESARIKAEAEAEARRRSEADEAKRKVEAEAEARRRADADEGKRKTDSEAEARRSAEMEQAKRKAESEAAERAKALEEIQKARQALAAAEAARERAEAEAERLKAEVAARAKAEAEAAKQRAEAETAAKAKAEAEAAAKKRAEAEAAAAAKAKAEADAATRAKAEAEAAARQKAEAEAAAAAKARSELEAAARQRAIAEAAAATKAKTEAEAAAAKARAEADAAAKQRVEAEAAAAKAKAEAEAATKQKADADAAVAKARQDSVTAAKQTVEATVAASAAQQKNDDEQRKAAESSELALRLSVADRQRLQVALTALGFDTRGADGVFGPRSREMITTWQRQRNLPATGFLSTAQQQALLRDAAPAITKYDDEQKKKAEEEAKRKEEEARTRAAQQPTQPTAAAPSVAPPAAPPVASAPQPSGSRDGLWFGALDCKNMGRQSIQGNVTNGRGRLSGTSSIVTMDIAGSTASISVQSQTATGVAGPMSGELRGRSVFARGMLQRLGGGPDECSVSLVGP